MILFRIFDHVYKTKPSQDIMKQTLMTSFSRILVVGAHWDTVDKTGGLNDNG